MDDYALKRLEREARARHQGHSRVGAPSRSSLCELCGQGDVRWGSMCQDCRARLLGGEPEPAAEATAIARPTRNRRRRRTSGSVIAPAQMLAPAPDPTQTGRRGPGMSLIQNVPGAIYRCLTDAQRTVVFVTHQIRSVTGLDAAEFRPGSSNLASLVHPEDVERVAAEIASSLPDEALELEYRVLHPIDGVRWVHDRAQVVMDEGGRRFMDGMLVDITQRRIAQEEMAWLALHDPLTALPNRRALGEQLAAELESVDDRRHLSAAIFDIDHFKSVNDTHGHDRGDEALVEVARRLREAFDGIGFVARTGGEEFVVLLPNHSLAQATVIADLARRAVEDALVSELAISVSAGVSCLASGIDLLGNADTALYRAKHEGRNRVVAFP